MAFWDALYKEFGRSGILNSTKDQNELIEGVLFDIWVRGHLERTTLQSAAIPLLSMVLGLFLSIVALPYNLARRFSLILLSALVAGVVFLAGASTNIVVSAFFLALIFLCRDDFLRILRDFSYDVADILLFGRITERKLKVLQACGPIKRFQGDKLLEHLFVSRILVSGALHREAEAFQETCILLKDDWPRLHGFIEGYWERGRFSKDYWGNSLLMI